MTVKDIVIEILESNPILFDDMVKQWLRDEGYDGIYNPDGDCGCALEDFMPCIDEIHECKPGYKKMGCPPDCGLGCKFHIVEEKPDVPKA